MKSAYHDFTSQLKDVLSTYESTRPDFFDVRGKVTSDVLLAKYLSLTHYQTGKAPMFDILGLEKATEGFNEEDRQLIKDAYESVMADKKRKEAVVLSQLLLDIENACLKVDSRSRNRARELKVDSDERV